MGRKGGKKSGTEASELLNFHFATVPPPRNQQRPANRPRQGQYHENKKTSRKSGTLKRQNNHFPLVYSPNHSFILTRIPHKSQSYSFQGLQSSIAWQSVRVVQQFVTDALECPICLDTLVCPRSTKCGHVYCLSCIIHHCQSHAAHNPYQPIKCPCCGLRLELPEVRPVTFWTIQTPRLNDRVIFVKLYRNRSCPYLPHGMAHSAAHAAPLQTDENAVYSKFQYVDPVVYQELLQANREELLTLPEPDICKHLALAHVDAEILEATQNVNQEVDLMDRFASPGSGVYQQTRPRGLSVESEASATSNHSTDGPSVFYQAQDGSLCFLSGFNLQCLRKEYSSTDALPDTVEGKILQIDHCTKHFKFLGHLPETDTVFCEIGLGHVLSKTTKAAFRDEFQARQKARAKAHKLEHQADVLQAQREQERIEALKSRFKRIDPEDAFFHSPVPANEEVNLVDIGPSLSSSPTLPTPATASGFSFSQIAREGGHFPALGSADNFPTLGSSPPSPRSSWGRPPPIVSTAAPAPSSDVKKKKKKVLLFSTGGHRGAIS